LLHLQEVLCEERQATPLPHPTFTALW